MARTQKQLDDVIRANKGATAVESLVADMPRTQQYRLSDGTYLIISKRTGRGWIETADGKQIRRF